MRPNSVYCADCVCGRHFETQLDDYVCPGCQRHIIIEWAIERERGGSPAEPPATCKTKDAV